ncbi:unnamed protein product [Didymodactylos carnosus]|uniref:NADP-dependent oxidoreductase domain-containing protein n=1 Tax=Didymodactylos carnosus TaxID=1234261 RepID=A0A815QIJ7_9BILA|nr:unnamed protein product [Didymodactylos carnosus]CAF1463735.1 unnamed protein product [Didymodactylos carnosus]CAF4095320.1 unnamed protein product [Didymodactylos carnosus]CAF4333394.1 unnamed protein product [Didymodactylos carnosus]
MPHLKSTIPPEGGKDLSLASTVELNDGFRMPRLGLGVWETQPNVCEEAVLASFEVGYRHIDTAASYDNEAEVGSAVRKTTVPRSTLFITTKIWDDDQGYDSTIAAVQDSLKKSGLEYFDLILLHSALPGKESRLESWKALEYCVDKGWIRSIGVSNWAAKHFEELKATSPKIRPAVNQLELHPFLQQRPTVEYCFSNDIVVQAYSPLTRGQLLNNETITRIANSKGVDEAQVLIRWSLQKEDDMTALDALDNGYLTGSWGEGVNPLNAE